VDAITLVTGNRNKVLEAERILGRPLRAEKIDLPEIQGLDMGAILRAKAGEAWRRIGRPLIVEDVSLELDALGGFPGPLVKWMLEAVGPEGIARTALALGDPGVAARCVLLYKDGEREITAEGLTRGRLVLPPRGDGGFGWDPVVEAEALGKTFAEMSGAEKDHHGHRGRAWRALLPQLPD
jgi:non-canonical purine NTP pyrophosphatase (RdgB/HAM1 family)